MSEVIIIDPVKVLELQGPILAQLGKLVDACMRSWKNAPVAVKIELGDACALMNKLVKQENDDGDSSKDRNGS
jgi:hypothetical protein